jgi:hypothetical protein
MSHTQPPFRILLSVLKLTPIRLPQFKAAKKLIMDDDFWDRLGVAVRVLMPAFIALRYSDGMKGGSLALLYSLLSQLDVLYGEPIKGLDDDIRKKVCGPKPKPLTLNP